MIKPIPIIVLILIFTIKADFIIKGKAIKRNTVIKINDNFSQRCYHNNTVFGNNDTLKRIVLASQYIFTGKISSENKHRRGKIKSNLFKVFIRRVLKGSLSDVLFQTRTFNSTRRGYVFAESRSVIRGCFRGTQGWAALLFIKGEWSSPLKLLIDPIPTDLEKLRRVKAVVKGNSYLLATKVLL